MVVETPAMKNLLAVAVASLVGLSACGGDGGGPSLDGQWEYDPSNSSAAAITFDSSAGTYVSQLLVLTNTVTDSSGRITSASANDEIERGTFTAAGGTITFSPRQYSCPGADAAYQATYDFYQGGLRLVLQGAIVVWQRESGSTMGASYVLTTGCFDGSGGFTQYPLAAVQN